MSRIFISADFEGVSGVVAPRACFPGGPEFERTRRLWIGEINALVEGALEGGADEILVNEAHAAMNYLDPELLHPRARFISGYLKPDNQMEGLGPEFSGAILMAHARAGTAAGVLNHTYVMRDVVEVRLNGSPIGEIGLNMHWAAVLGVPVILVAGDDHAAAEARSLVPEVQTAVVKTGISQFTACSLPAAEARRVLREAAAAAVRRVHAMPRIAEAGQYTMEIEFSLTEIAAMCCLVPGIERIGPRTVGFTSRDYRRLQGMRIVCTNLALATVRAHFG